MTGSLAGLIMWLDVFCCEAPTMVDDERFDALLRNWAVNADRLKMRCAVAHVGVVTFPHQLLASVSCFLTKTSGHYIYVPCNHSFIRDGTSEHVLGFQVWRQWLFIGGSQHPTFPSIQFPWLPIMMWEFPHRAETSRGAPLRGLAQRFACMTLCK